MAGCPARARAHNGPPVGYSLAEKQKCLEALKITLSREEAMGQCGNLHSSLSVRVSISLAPKKFCLQEE